MQGVCSASKHAVSPCSPALRTHDVLSLEACRTVGSSGVPCVFPFIYRDVTYNACTDKDSDTGQPWCATKVDSEGWVLDHKWGGESEHGEQRHQT